MIGVSPIPASVTLSAAIDNLVNGLAMVVDNATDKKSVTNIVIMKTLTKPCRPSCRIKPISPSSVVNSKAFTISLSLKTGTVT